MPNVKSKVFVMPIMISLLPGHLCLAAEPSESATLDFVVRAFQTCEYVTSATRNSSEITLNLLFPANKRHSEDRKDVVRFDLRNIRNATESDSFLEAVPGKEYLFIGCEQPNCILENEHTSNFIGLRCGDMNSRLSKAISSYIKRFGLKEAF